MTFLSLYLFERNGVSMVRNPFIELMKGDMNQLMTSIIIPATYFRYSFCVHFF